MIEIDHDPERSPCGIHLYPAPVLFCARCRQGTDLHTAAAAEIFGVALADVTPEQRKHAKAATFAGRYARHADQRSSPAARERARERGQARAAADPLWGQAWTPTAIGAGD